MELRHLRYFVAVAEEGSLTVAAERPLHTAQPSLSRQIRDLEYLEYEVGAQLLTRSPRRIALTAAGLAILHHAPLALAQTPAPLAPRRPIATETIADEIFIGMSKPAPTLQAIIDDYLKRSGHTRRAEHKIDNLGMAMSLVASTRGVTLLPAYAQNFLTWSVVSRPLRGEAPTIDLVIGYHKANTSPILKLFLSKSDDLISRVSNKLRTAASASV